MKWIKSSRIAIALIAGVISIPLIGGPPAGAEATVIIHNTELPTPDLKGRLPLENTLANLTDCQGLDPDIHLTKTELGQLLWATATGVTSSGHAPDPGATSPCDLQIYAVTHNNLHLYDPAGHSCRSSLRGSLIDSLSSLVNFDTARVVKDAALVVILVGDLGGCQGHLGKRGDGFLLLSAGGATRNLRLQAQALGLGSLACTMFRREPVAQLLRIPDGWQPLSLIAIGSLTKENSK